MKLLITALLTLCLSPYLSPIAIAEEELLVRYHQSPRDIDRRDDYFVALLELALRKTENSDGPYLLVSNERKMTQQRTLANLEQGRYLDVVWTMTSAEREQQLLPVRIPLLRGLLGHRVFIIREEDRQLFEQITKVEDLQQLKAGQGKDWPDTEILQANRIPVVTGSNYQGLFGMLRAERFDYFPRGVNEPWEEIRIHADKQLAVEPNLVLQYPAPVFFFVNKQNHALQARLERGLRLALEDGSFFQLFYEHPSNHYIFEVSRLAQRRMFQLRNPLLSEETAALLSQSELWYHPDECQQQQSPCYQKASHHD
ncbi:hypothetical protein [Aliagarivorans marinus]|uniref:hypothetical protein n=1 Tax=Aliagarivorans marinus TaxID=561965 RepID=UPI00041E5C96|nr:hypothetical protein [Aliagarivorans marinus]